MANYPKQIVVEKPLLDFLNYCEVYCNAACCGLEAFEIHKALLLSRQGQENSAKRNGDQQFAEAWEQAAELNTKFKTLTLEKVNDELPIWGSDNLELPFCWLSESNATTLFSKLEEAFAEAAKYSGVNKAHQK